jgi:transketolase
MRNAFIKAITEIGKDENVILLINDTGEYLLKDFRQRYPSRLINVGIAEQNMVGLAAGLAASGKTVFVYSIASFFARCYEQIKVDVAYHNLNVKFVGVGAGLAYGTMGITHHSTEDIAIMRVLPNMTIISPCDPIETEQASVAAYNHPGPVYLRLGLIGEPNLHYSNYNFTFKGIDVIKDGEDIAIISTGRMVKTALEAAEILKNSAVSAMVVNISIIKPLPYVVNFLVHQCKVKAILTIEEHNVIGGLGSAIAEDIARSDIEIPFQMTGIYNQFCTKYGSWSYLQEKLCLSATHIVLEALALLRIKHES